MKNYVKNLIILVVKYYIYSTKMNDKILNIMACKRYVKKYYSIEKYIWIQREKCFYLRIAWEKWLDLFREDI